MTQPVMALLERLAERGARRIVLFPAHSESVPLPFDDLRQRWPGLQVALLARSDSPILVDGAGAFDEAIVFHERTRKSPTELLKSAVRVIGQVRQWRAEAFVVWFGQQVIFPNFFLLETLALWAGAKEKWLCADPENMRYRATWVRFVFLRLPELALKVVAALSLALSMYITGWIGLARKPARLSTRLKHHDRLRIAYLRTDLELRLYNMRTGGSVAHTKGVIDGFLKCGTEVIALSSGPLSAVDASRVRTHIISPQLFRDYPVELMEMFQNFTFYEKAREILDASPPDLIYQRYSLYNFVGVWLARRYRVPLALETNDSEVLWRREHSRLVFDPVALMTEKGIFNQATSLLAVSRRVKEDLISLGVNSDKIHILPNAADPDRFGPHISGAEVRARYDLDGKVVVTFVGNFYPWHGIPTLAEAIPLVAEKDLAVHFLLVGDGKDRPAVSRMVAERRLEDRVTLAGIISYDKVPEYMAAADILVSPHAPIPGFIGSPVKIFEYLAAGKAIIASRLEQIGEVIQHECNGLNVTPGNAEELAEAILRLAGDPALRERLGGQARLDSVTHYTWGKNCQTILSMLGYETREPALERGAEKG